MCLRPSCSTISTIAFPGWDGRRAGTTRWRPTVLQLDPGAQLSAEFLHRTGDLGDIVNGHAACRVLQPVRQLAVVGQQQQPSVSASSRPTWKNRSDRLAT